MAVSTIKSGRQINGMQTLMCWAVEMCPPRQIYVHGCVYLNSILPFGIISKYNTSIYFILYNEAKGEDC